MGVDACSGLAAGIPVIRCLFGEASFVPGFVLVFLTFGFIFFRLSDRDVASRIATATFITTLIASLLGFGGLFPDVPFSVLVVLMLASGAVLFTRRKIV